MKLTSSKQSPLLSETSKTQSIIPESDTPLRVAAGRHSNYFVEMACERKNNRTRFLIRIFHKPGTTYAKQGVMMTIEKSNLQDLEFWRICQIECSELLCEEEFDNSGQFFRAFENAIERCHLYAPIP
ncbi:MAG: hypothetical protein OQK04_05170 [Kangiellaceae bacterium]|nr:hypothetical protein [Kangiellaceae bacterium]MCW8998086.1 hypothetical protein [Kangiellaceae bacterium]